MRQRIRDIRVGGDILESFDADDPEASIDSWITKIDQLGTIHGWTENERAYFAQTKLKGAAKKWFYHLDNYDLIWASWNIELRRTFPRRDNFADRLEELVGRHKLSDKKMATNYHAKMVLLGCCNITGINTVSVIIKGLPVHLRAGAHAAKCETLSELFQHYLAGINTFPSGCVDVSTGAISKRRPATDMALKAGGGRPIQVVCYNCKMNGHFSRDCPKPRVDRCKICRQEGHMAFRCPEARRDTTPKLQDGRVKRR